MRIQSHSPAAAPPRVATNLPVAVTPSRKAREPDGAPPATVSNPSSAAAPGSLAALLQALIEWLRNTDSAASLAPPRSYRHIDVRA